MTFDDEHIYHQGFLDCIYLLRWRGFCEDQPFCAIAILCMSLGGKSF